MICFVKISYKCKDKNQITLSSHNVQRRAIFFGNSGQITVSYFIVKNQIWNQMSAKFSSGTNNSRQTDKLIGWRCGDPLKKSTNRSACLQIASQKFPLNFCKSVVSVLNITDSHTHCTTNTEKVCSVYLRWRFNWLFWNCPH